MKCAIKGLFAIIAAICCLSLSACTGGFFEGGGSSSGSPSGTTSGGGSSPSEQAPDDDISFENTILNISATDALGRFTDRIGGFKDGKYVGIFYFLWIGEHGSAYRDISKLSLAEQQAKTDVGVHHYWSEPLYGYYHSADPWVFRKHLELLTFAGVDYIAFDATNAYTYTDVLDNLLPVAFDLLEDGIKIPKFMFILNTATAETAQSLYDTYYDPTNPSMRKYDELWFRGDDNGANTQGKPWISGDAGQFATLPASVRSAFHFRPVQWPTVANLENGFPWMSWEKGYTQYNHSGMMSVSVAQHTSGAFSDPVFLSDRTLCRGRGWSPVDGKNDESRVLSGANFQAQWQNAINAKPAVNNVFVTGWNEWVAQKQNNQNRSTSYFVDLYNMEFSRDVEMMKGGYGDNYYMQLVTNTRAFKMDASLPKKSNYLASVEIYGDETEWKGTTAYLDFTGETQPRNFKSANESLPNYVSDTGRNDIKCIRMTSDSRNVYVLIECTDNITLPRDNVKNWMNMFVQVDGDRGTSWNNYGYVINRTVNNDGISAVERLSPDGTSVRVGDADFYTHGRYLTLCIPRSALGVDSGAFTLRFKVADGITDTSDIMNYYVEGDCAPIGRLNYTYAAER